MAFPKHKSVFSHIASRELNPLQVRKRPRMEGFKSGYTVFGYVGAQHNAEDTVPLSLSFCKTSKYCHIIALSDEDGYVNLFDICRKFHPSDAELNGEKAKICDWVSHDNAVFDVCWIKEDTQILTASGDQTMKIWDVQAKKCLGVLAGHTGSVKSVSSHPTNADIIVSGSRDGSFRLWDLRCNTISKTRSGEMSISSMAVVEGAHLSSQSKRVTRRKAASMSITSVLYLKDQVSIATAGAVESVVKFWDTRNLRSIVTQTCPHPQSTEKHLHGISSLSQDDSGLFLTASCMDNRVYLYNTLQLEKGPLMYFTGCRIESFFVKAAISPDAEQIVCGSSNGRAYVWEINKPQEHTVLKSHSDEVTAVDWCSSDITRLATTSDDSTVHIWNKSSRIPPPKNPTATMRRRIIAVPSNYYYSLFEDNEETCRKSDGDAFLSKEAPHHQIKSATPITPPKMNTPEGHKNQLSSGFDQTLVSEKTPESASKSPSSVLNPPSSLKRTIRDYFLASS